LTARRAMYRFLICALTGFFFVIGTSPVLSAERGDNEAPERFQYRSIVEGPELEPGSTVYAVPLDTRVLESCLHVGCPDMRIFGPAGQEVPFVVLKSTKLKRRKSYTFKISGFQTQEDGSSALDFSHEKGAPRVSEITIDIDDVNFRRKAALYGLGGDGLWELIRNDDIYDFSAEVPLRRTTIETGGTQYASYRLVLSAHEGPEAGRASGQEMTLSYGDLYFHSDGKNLSRRPLKVSAIRGSDVLESEGYPFDESPLEGLRFETDEKGDSVAVFSSPIPFERITLNIATPYFYRTVRLYHSANGREDSFVPLAGAEVYSFPLSVGVENSSSIDVPSVGNGHYRLVIRNNETPPLDIRGAMLGWAARTIYFTPSSGKQAGVYAVYTGNPHIRSGKVYDISRFITPASALKMDYTWLEALSPEKWEGYEPAPDWSRREKIEILALKSVVLVIVLGLVIWIVTLLRKGAGQRK